MNTIASTPALWLIGEWRSNRTKTIEAWGAFPPGSPAFQSILGRDLGRLHITYNGLESTTEFNGSFTRAPYKVLWQSADAAFLVTGSGEEESGQHLHFESPSIYWVHAGRFVEYFTKV